MPGTLTLRTFVLNQKLNDYLLPFPIRWNRYLQRWENDKQKEPIFYILANLATSIWLLLCFCALGVYINAPEVFTASQILLTLIQIVVAISCVVFLLLTMLQSDNIIRALNMMYEVEEDKWYHAKIVPQAANRTSRQVRIFRDSTSDITGVVIFSSVFLATGAAMTTCASAVVLNGLDPMHMLMTYYWGKQKLTNIASASIFIIPSIIYLHIVNVSLIILRYSVMFYIYAGMTLYQIINLIFKVKPNLNSFSLNMFRQLAILLNQFRPVTLLVTSGGLATFFGTLVVGANSIVIGMLLDDIRMELIGIMVTLTAFGLVQIIFFFCCHIFEDSSGLLNDWTDRALRMNDGGHMRRAVKGLRVLSIPTGDVGVFDRDIKMNYFSKVIDYITNVLLICMEVYVN